MRRFLPFLALSLFPAVASADEIDDAMLVMVDAANSAYGGTPVNASATKRLRPSTIEAQLRKMATKLELRNCLVGADQWVAGSYGGGTVAGSHEAGDLLNGAFTITPNVFSFDLHDTGVTVGDELGRFRQGKLVAHRSDDGYVAGRFVRTAGRNGVFLAFQDSCEDPALALEPWYGVSLADWPESEPGPETERIIFLSSSTFPNGDLGGIAGADAVCQSLADNASPALSGTFKAWLASSTYSPTADFVQSTLPYRLVGGVQIAADWAGLVNNLVVLDAPINVDESGTTILGTDDDHVWTGVNRNGNWTGQSCGAFDSATPGTPQAGGTAIYGLTNRTNLNWTQANGDPCDRAGNRIYCVEQ